MKKKTIYTYIVPKLFTMSKSELCSLWLHNILMELFPADDGTVHFFCCWVFSNSAFVVVDIFRFLKSPLYFRTQFGCNQNQRNKRTKKTNKRLFICPSTRLKVAVCGALMWWWSTPCDKQERTRMYISASNWKQKYYINFANERVH